MAAAELPAGVGESWKGLRRAESAPISDALGAPSLAGFAKGGDFRFFDIEEPTAPDWS